MQLLIELRPNLPGRFAYKVMFSPFWGNIIYEATTLFLNCLGNIFYEAIRTKPERFFLLFIKTSVCNFNGIMQEL